MPHDVTLGEVKFTLAISAPVVVAWDTLVHKIGAWWPDDYRALGAHSVIELHAQPGGLLTEIDPTGAALVWYQVQQLQPGESILMSGYIAPPYGGPAQSLLRWTLAPVDAAHTSLHLHDSLTGRFDPQAIEAGWRDIMGGFVKRCVAAA
jgi:hypothetical protein